MLHALCVLLFAGIGTAQACSCADSSADGWLIYPAEGDEVAADAALFWRGDEQDADFTVLGPDGAVAVDVEWWVSGTGTDVAVIRPRQGLDPDADYAFTNSTTTVAFSTGVEATSPVAGAAEPGSVCVDVSSEYDGDCSGTTFTLELPPLDAGFWMAELTDEAGESYRVLGDSEGVRPSRGLCSSTFLDATDWQTASVRAAEVSLAGDVGAWSATYSGEMPTSGTVCLDVENMVPARCGCGSAEAAPALWLAAALAAALRRPVP